MKAVFAAVLVPLCLGAVNISFAGWKTLAPHVVQVDKYNLSKVPRGIVLSNATLKNLGDVVGSVTNRPVHVEPTPQGEFYWFGKAGPATARTSGTGTLAMACEQYVVPVHILDQAGRPVSGFGGFDNWVLDTMSGSVLQANVGSSPGYVQVEKWRGYKRSALNDKTPWDKTLLNTFGSNLADLQHLVSKILGVPGQLKSPSKFISLHNGQEYQVKWTHVPEEGSVPVEILAGSRNVFDLEDVSFLSGRRRGVVGVVLSPSTGSPVHFYAGEKYPGVREISLSDGR